LGKELDVVVLLDDLSVLDLLGLHQLNSWRKSAHFDWCLRLISGWSIELVLLEEILQGNGLGGLVLDLLLDIFLNLVLLVFEVLLSFTGISVVFVLSRVLSRVSEGLSAGAGLSFVLTLAFTRLAVTRSSATSLRSGIRILGDVISLTLTKVFVK
jgi:hypothetical protein